ncbi:MAG: transglycosylase domain-containing protein, partial [Candidatus Binatia bacterium]
MSVMIRSSNPEEPVTSARARTVAFVAGALASFAAALGLALVSIEIEERASATVITDAAGEPIRLILPADGRLRFRARLEEVSPVLRTALVAAEDRRFFDHSGVDLRAIARATWTNLRAGRVVSGGSTIPMQIARMTMPAERTFGAKLGDAIRAVLFDARHSKDELLEAYLNLAPFGANIEGVGAASAFWFGKRPSELSLGEAALLTALPRAPNAYDPVANPEAARRARDRVLDQLER